jgi:hypothetical protein
MNPANWNAVPEAERDDMMTALEKFVETITQSGELVSTHALADPAESSVVRVRDGVPAVTDGPYVEAKEFLAGLYLIDVESKERALELTAQIPDASVNAMEIRPVIFSAGQDI